MNSQKAFAIVGIAVVIGLTISSVVQSLYVPVLPQRPPTEIEIFMQQCTRGDSRSSIECIKLYLEKERAR